MYTPSLDTKPKYNMNSLQSYKQIESNHADLVIRLCKKPEEIKISLTFETIDCLHAILGIGSEAGELLDAVKKTFAYNKPLDVENIIEELGDLEFYMQQLRCQLDIRREETLQANIDKLNKRYPLGYTDQAAAKRADKLKKLSK